MRTIIILRRYPYKSIIILLQSEMRARVSRQFDTNSGTRPIIHVREVLEASTRITCVLLLSEERREKKHKLYIISLLVSVQVKTAWTTRRSYDSYNIYRTHTERSEWSRRISLKNAFRYYRRSMRSCAHFFFFMSALHSQSINYLSAAILHHRPLCNVLVFSRYPT